jgi:hypothetical protein
MAYNMPNISRAETTRVFFFKTKQGLVPVGLSLLLLLLSICYFFVSPASAAEYELQVLVQPSSISIAQAGTATATLSVKTVPEQHVVASLGASGLPTSVTLTCNPPQGTTPFTSQLRLDVSSGATPGIYQIFIKALDTMGNTATATLMLEIVEWQPPLSLRFDQMACPPATVHVEEPFTISGVTLYDAPSTTEARLRVFADSRLLETFSSSLAGVGTSSFQTSSYSESAPGQYTYTLTLEYYDHLKEAWVLTDKHVCTVSVIPRTYTVKVSVIGLPSSVKTGVYVDGKETAKIGSGEVYTFNVAVGTVAEVSADSEIVTQTHPQYGAIQRYLVEKPKLTASSDKPGDTVNIQFNYREQFLIRVERIFLDEQGRKEVVMSTWFDKGSSVQLPGQPAVSPSPGVQYRPLKTRAESISATAPITITDEYGTFCELTGETRFGTIEGLGWYRKGLTAEWNVSPTVVSHEKVGFLGVVLRPQPKSGDITMDSPKKVSVQWDPDYLPLLAILALVVSILSPCRNWPPWRPPRTPPGLPPTTPTPTEPGPSTVPMASHLGTGGILQSRAAKMVGTWAPVGLYILSTSLSAYEGLSTGALISLTVTGVLLGAITGYKAVSCYPVCGIEIRWLFHTMDLNVWPTGIIRTPADDPMPLKAFAYDKHVLIQECPCVTGISRKNHILGAKVRYEWEIIAGEGGFIRINDGEESKTQYGEQVVYQPPDIEAPDQTKTVTIRVTAYHDDPTKPPNHRPCVSFWNIQIKREVRETGSPSENNHEFTDPGEVTDEYVYTFSVSSKQCPSPNALPPEQKGECLPKYIWLAGSSIDGKVRSLPEPVCSGDFVRLEAKGTDTDKLLLECLPTGETCQGPARKELTLNDLLEYEWEASKGSFPRGNTGREIVWQAPDEEGEVKIKLKIKDVGGQYDDPDKELNTTVVVRKLGIDLVKTPPAWLPIATAGTLQLPARIHMCKDNKWVYPGRKKFIRLKLKRVSRERGVCLNYPRNGNTNPDLFFYEERMRDDYILTKDKTITNDCRTEILVANDNPAHDHHYLYTVSKKRRAEAMPTIRCEDYGAIGFLEASANHCVQIPPRDTADAPPCGGRVECCTGANEVKIPRDENNNDIADSAPQDAAGAAGNTDNDNNPIGDAAHPGDGLTNYEEYRGFIVGGGARPKAHRRTDVNNKDVFIYDEDNLGTGFLNQTGLTIHLLYDEDLFDRTARRVINFNRCNNARHGSGNDQHGIWLRRRAIAGVYGRACNGPGLPRDVTHVCINQALCTAVTEHPNQLNTTLAHELGHAINIRHHGQGGKHNCGGMAETETNGLQTSGDGTCVMRYDNYANAWCHGAPHHRHAIPQNALANDGATNVEASGTTYCNSANATGVNVQADLMPVPLAPVPVIVTNNATRGDCQHQIRVKDW